MQIDLSLRLRFNLFGCLIAMIDPVTDNVNTQHPYINVIHTMSAHSTSIHQTLAEVCANLL